MFDVLLGCHYVGVIDPSAIQVVVLNLQLCPLPGDGFGLIMCG